MASMTLACPACGSPVAPSQKFCGECAAPLKPAPGSATPSGTVGKLSPPAPSPPLASTAAAALPVTPVAEEERRLVTALFCDLVGFTPLSELLDPEDVREIQAAYFAAMSAEIRRYGGIVEKYAGDAVLALFGVPVAHEDDPERAVLCALAMRRALEPVADDARRRHGVDIAIRTGVNTGEVVSGNWDAAGGQQAAVTGDAVNVAARMQAAAEPGGVLVGEETRRLSARRLRFGERQALTLKGKAEPVPAYVVLGTREQVEERWEGDEGARRRTPLVGRERELESIRTAWARAQADEGAILTVVGEPGIGKSRLVAEGVERITRDGEAKILHARCLSYGQSVSLWLIADLLRSLCSLPEDAGPETVRDHIAHNVDEVLSGADETDRAIARDVLGEVLGLPPGDSLVAAADPSIRRSALVRILGLILAALSERAPVLLLLEDLHWLDTASSEILDALLREVRGRAILVLATQRPGGTPPWAGWEAAQQVILHPLGAGDAATLAQAVLGDASLADDLQVHLRDRAEGNPFFVEELVHYLRETGGLETADGEIRLRPSVAEKLPATLTEVLLARLDRMESQVKTVAQVGSVIGRSFAVRLLAQVMEREEALLADPLRSLQEAEITYPTIEGEVQHVFRHVLLRDAAYSMLLRRRQRQLHLATARAIAQLYPAEEYVEMIAYHYSRTEEDAEAARWLEKAGDRAAAAYANEAAIGHYQAALQRLERCGAGTLRLAAIEEKLGGVYLLPARHAEAREVLERAIGRYRAAGDLQAAARATTLVANALRREGDLEEAGRRLEEIAALLAGSGPSAAAARVHAHLSNVFQFRGGYREMLREAEHAEHLARAAGDEGLRGGAEERRGTALTYLGRLEEGREALEEAIRLLEAAGDLHWLSTAVGNLSWNRNRAGDLAQAFQLTERSLELSVREGDVQNLILSHLNLASDLVHIGQWDRARAHVDRAEDIGTPGGISSFVAPYVPLMRGMLALLAGEWPEAARQLSRAVTLAEGTDAEALQHAQCLLAELDVLEGRMVEARDRLETSLAAPDPDMRMLLPTLAWAHLKLGAAERALELADQAERASREGGVLFHLPETLRIKGMALRRLGRLEEAGRALSEGRERAVAMPNPYTEARTLVELGLLERHEGHQEQAVVRLAEALAIFRRLGATKDMERTAQALARLASP